MQIRLGAGLLSFAVSLFALGSVASADDWHVVQSSGDVWLSSSAAQPIALTSSATVADGATIVTGAAGRAMLARGEQTMLVGPNSVATVPEASEQGFVTILERSGRIEFDVDKQKDPHFAVETPYLAAVVKGTHFVVDVDPDGAQVSVDRGLVQVTDLATGEVADTPAGQGAHASGQGGHLNIFGSGTLATVTQGSPRTPMVDRLSAEQLQAIQSSSANGSAPDLGTSHQDSASSGFVVVAGNSGGGSGDGGSGSDTGATGGNIIGAPPAAGASDGPSLQSVVTGATAAAQIAVDDGAHFPRADRSAGNSGISPLTIALVFAISLVLAFGFAFLRGRVT